VSLRCPGPVDGPTLVDYWLGELHAEAEQRVEEHLFSCEDCHRASAEIGTMVRRLEQLVPTVMTRPVLEQLGRRFEVRVGDVPPGGETTIHWPRPGALHVHRLIADLTGVERLDLALFLPDGTAVGDPQSVPFDPASGEVLVTCQSHFSQLFPAEFLIRLFRVEGESSAAIAEYTLRHLP
jgi:hypothetical protein